MHLFISHAARDGAGLTQEIVAALESLGHACWYAPRDIRPGTPYPGQIVSAIESCGGLVMLVTPAANESAAVLQEAQLAATARKTIAPVMVDGCAPGTDLRYYLGVRHQIPWTGAKSTAENLLRSFPVPAGKSEASPQAAPLARQFADVLASLNAPAADTNARCDVYVMALGPDSDAVHRIIDEHTGGGLFTAKVITTGFPPFRVASALPADKAEALASALKTAGASTLPLSRSKA